MTTKGSANVKGMFILTLVTALITLAGVAEAQRMRMIRVATYTLTDLGALAGDGTWSFAQGINSSGQVVGEFDFWSGGVQIQRGFRTMANQQFLPGTSDELAPLMGDANSGAFAVNGNGVVIGDSVDRSGWVNWSDPSGKPSHAFRSLSAGSAPQDMQTPSYADRYYARGIDSAGRMVGFVKNTGSTLSRAIFSSCGPGCAFPLDVPLNFPTQSEAYGVNFRGDIVGWRQMTQSQGGRLHAFELQVIGNNQWRAIDIAGLPGGFWSKAFAINDSGFIVGESGTSSGGQHAFLFRDENSNGVQDANEIYDIDRSGSTTSGARGMNSSSTVVGYIGGDSTMWGTSHAAVFSGAGPTLDLNTLIPATTGRWVLRLATGVNDNGQIVGYMDDSTEPNVFLKTRHAFRLDISGFTYVPW